MDLSVLLEACVRGRLNIVLSGGTGTGKTTALNVLSGFVPEDERIITIEDTAELQLQQPHVVSLESRPANIEGAGEISIRDLVRNALRMRPNRIIVGECRGAEALDMLQAMNTGHEGSLTTVHSNSPRDALRRLETMVLMSGHDLPVRVIREQLSSALDLIIQLDRLPNGRRVVSAVTEIQGLEGDTVLLQDVFALRDGTLMPTGLRPRFLERLREADVEVPARLFRMEPLTAADTPTESRGRLRRIPSARELAEPERAR
jgi:pilus assembly protein CpaF